MLLSKIRPSSLATLLWDYSELDKDVATIRPIIKSAEFNERGGHIYIKLCNSFTDMIRRTDPLQPEGLLLRASQLHAPSGVVRLGRSNQGSQVLAIISLLVRVTDISDTVGREAQEKKRESKRASAADRRRRRRQSESKSNAIDEIAPPFEGGVAPDSDSDSESGEENKEENKENKEENKEEEEEKTYGESKREGKREEKSEERKRSVAVVGVVVLLLFMVMQIANPVTCSGFRDKSKRLGRFFARWKKIVGCEYSTTTNGCR